MGFVRITKSMEEVGVIDALYLIRATWGGLEGPPGQENLVGT